MAETIPVYIHEADGTFRPDDPFIVAGTEVELIEHDDYWGWDSIGRKGIITENDVRYTAQYKEQLKKKKRAPDPEQHDTVYVTWMQFNDRPEDPNYQVQAKCLKVIN